MRVNTLFFLTIVACTCLALAKLTYEDCCLTYVKKLRPRTHKYIVNYRWQFQDGGCNLQAVIFTTRKGRIVCTDPKERWVNGLMKVIDQRNNKKHSKTVKHNSRG